MSSPVTETNSAHPTDGLASDSSERASVSNGKAAWWSWASLIRLPNTFTVIADSTAGFLLAAGTLEPIGRYLPTVLSVVLLYWSGMVLNDLWDVQRDRIERPGRPLAAGRISLGAARTCGWGLMAIGIVFAGISGQIPASGLANSWLPLIVAASIGLCVWLYDGPLKRTPLAPIVMGGCRVGSLLLGAAPVASARLADHELWFPLPVWFAAIGMGIFICGITTAGRREADVGGDRTYGPLLGFSLVLIGLAIIAGVSRAASPLIPWFFDGQVRYPLLIALLGATVAYRGFIAVRYPQPRYLQAFVKQGILLIIPLSAALAALAAGSTYGLAVFALVLPAMSLAKWFRVT